MTGVQTCALPISGVYKIPTKKCEEMNTNFEQTTNFQNNTDSPQARTTGHEKDKFYIGSTKRSIKIRLNEHMKNWEDLQEKTSLIEYCKEAGFEPDWTNIEILKKSKHEKMIRISEMILIEKTKEHNCNKKLGTELAFPWKLLIQQEKDDLVRFKNSRKIGSKPRRWPAERERPTLERGE